MNDVNNIKVIDEYYNKPTDGNYAYKVVNEKNKED